MGRTSKLLIFLLLIATFTTVNNLAFNFAAAQNAFLQSKNDGAVNKDIASNKDIPSAESVYSSQSMTLPKSVGYFIWYIADEAHENSNTAMHKHVSDHNTNYLPTNLTSH